MLYNIPMSNKTILIVEDSPYLSESLVDMIRMRGFEPITASTGKAGVELAINHKPDLILLDIRLPDIDGYEVYRRIRENDWGAEAKIIVLTASESTENISKNINLPPELILFKPEWSVKDLLSKIAEQLD